MSGRLQVALTVVNTWCARVAGLILLVSLAAVLYAITVRSVIGQGATWAFDLTSYGLLFVAFLAAPRTLALDGHIRVDFFASRLNERGRLVAEVVVQVLSLMFLLLLLWAVSNKTLQAIDGEWVSPSMYEIPLRYVYWIMPGGTVLMVLVCLTQLAAAVVRLRADGHTNNAEGR